MQSTTQPGGSVSVTILCFLLAYGCINMCHPDVPAWLDGLLNRCAFYSKHIEYINSVYGYVNLHIFFSLYKG